MNTKDLMSCTLGRRSPLFGLAIALWISIGSPTAWGQELFVTTSKNILVYGRAASGNTYPFRTLGELTLNEHMPALAVDAVNNELVVLLELGPLQAASEVLVYNPKADGTTAPIRGFDLGTASGGSTALAVDTVHDEIYIAHWHNLTLPNVLVYSRTAIGTPVPLRTLVGADTGLASPGGVAVDPVNDELLVLNLTGTVTVYNRKANGDTAPIRTLVTTAATGAFPTALTLDVVNDELFVTNDDDTVTVYNRTASGSSLPVRTLGLPAGVVPTGITLDSVNNELFVTYGGPGLSAVAVYSRTASGSDAPLRVLAGNRTGLGGISPAVTTSPQPRHIGSTTVGLFTPTNNGFSLWNNNTPGGPPDIHFSLGDPGDLPVAGDFNGDGVTTTGVFRPGINTNTFFLRNTTSGNLANLRIALGAPGDIPVIGDWNGDGVSTVGLFRPSTNTFYLWNYLATGVAPDLEVALGAPGDLPIAGDWDGNGTTTIGLYRPSTSTFYLWNSNTAGGFPDVSVALGAPGDLPVVGDWDGNGTTTVGVFRPSTNTFYLWNSNSISGAVPDIAVTRGVANDLPLVGDWDGL